MSVSSHKVAPSILSADFLELGNAIRMVNQSQADWIHVDVMDGMFVPNISFGFPILEAVRKIATKPLDVHLMIEKPERYIEAFAKAGADHLTVHLEASTHLDRSIQAIKEQGMKAGAALNPATPVEGLKHVLPQLDVVCLMSVNPGFGGQSFIPYTYDKIRRLKEMILSAGSSTLIEIDGGVNNKNAALLLEAGADVLVAGSFVFKAEDPQATIVDLKQVQAGTHLA
ncbi:MAG: ribulose-phosphate 3-epimerase [Bacteroidota bacterium]